MSIGKILQRPPVLLAICGVLLVVGTALWLRETGPGAHAGTDFGEYLAGARSVAAGVNPYHRLVVGADAQTGQRASGYVYPPLLAVALAAFLRLGFDGSALWILWNLVGVALTLVAAREIWRAGGVVGGRLAQWAGTLAVAVGFLLPAVTLYDLWLGQSDLILADLAVIALSRTAHGQRTIALLAAAVAIAVKPTLLVLPFVWLWRRDWRTALGASILAGALLLLPFAFAGPGALADYVTFTAHWNALGGDADVINQSLYGVLLRTFTTSGAAMPLVNAPWLVGPARWTLDALAVAGWLWATPRRPERDRLLALARDLLILPVALLVSPLAEDIHFTLLAPTLVTLIILLISRPELRGRVGAASGVIIAALLMVAPRMQEAIYPDRLVTLPGQRDPHLGPLIIAARGALLLILAAITLSGGAALTRPTVTTAAPLAQPEPSIAAVAEARSPD